VVPEQRTPCYTPQRFQFLRHNDARFQLAIAHGFRVGMSVACETLVCSVGRAVVELAVRKMRVEEVLAGKKDAEVQVGKIRKGFEGVREYFLRSVWER